jgi:chromosome segregation ATPase
MIIFRALHEKIDLMEELLESQGERLGIESAEAAKRPREIRLLINGLAATASSTDQRVAALTATVNSLLGKLTEYMSQNEELKKNLDRLAKMEADLVAKRVAEADLPQPTEFDKIF